MAILPDHYLKKEWALLTTGGQLWQEVCRAVEQAKSKEQTRAGQDIVHQLKNEWQEWNHQYVEEFQHDSPWVSPQWERGNRLLDLAQTTITQLTPVQDGSFILVCSADAPEWEKDVLCSWLETPRKTRVTASHVTIGVLFVQGETGATGKLALELIQDGKGVLYPSPFTNLFLTWDDDFKQAIDNATAFLEDPQCFPADKRQKLWPPLVPNAKPLQHYDVRWQLQRDDASPLPRAEGCSLGGAFAIGLWKLLSQDNELDLDGVSVTATIDKEGNLGAVGGLWPKLGAAHQEPSTAVAASTDSSGKQTAQEAKKEWPGDAFADTAQHGFIRLVVLADGQGVPDPYQDAIVGKSAS